MSNSPLYDDDILLWSEQQAAAIRQLGRTHRVPNDLDIENVAEEIESVGRSELAAVKSYIRLIFVHFIKLSMQLNAESAAHWRGEIIAFHSDMMGRYTPSMRQRIDVDQLWRSAREQTLESCEGEQRSLVASLPATSPFALEGLLVDRIDLDALISRLR
jgi:Domain of unknown function DUF29